MNKYLILALWLVTMLVSCGNNDGTAVATSSQQSGDSTLFQFSDIDMNKMFAYCDEEGDTLYFDNSFRAFWPQMIKGKPCPALQQALLRAMTDSAGLNQLDKVIDFLLDPSNYTDYDSKRLVPVKEVKDGDKLSTSDVNVVMESKTDRLLVYRLSTSSYMAGGAHGIYANNYVNYDLKTDKAIAFEDVIADTTLLRTVIYKAIKAAYDYDKDELFIPDNGLLPLPRDFHIDDNVFHVVYQVYEIASYAQGMIDAPIYPYMLKPEEMKRLFTPYGLELTNYDF